MSGGINRERVYVGSGVIMEITEGKVMLLSKYVGLGDYGD